MITRETILGLIEKARDPSISIFQPTHVKGEQVQQDPIRFKNLLKQAEKKLADQNVDPATIERLLEEPRKLLDQPLFWQHADKGLAVFVTEDTFEYFRIPLSFREQVQVENHFLITPLIPMITLDGSYTVLCLSQKNIRLLKCTRNDVEPIELKEAPGSLDEYLKYDVNERHLQHHSGQGKGRAIFHGQGGSSDTDNKEVENYLKAVENEVTSILKKRNDPLILAGVDDVVARYRKVNHYNRLMEQSVTGNPDNISNTDIKNEGWEVIKSFFLKDMYNDMDRFADLTGSERQSDNLSKIVEAAYYGKVDSLFVPIGEQSWGWFDRERDTVHHSTDQQNGEHDLINAAAIKTISQGGNVYALDKEDMPNRASIAAIFRY